MTRAWVETASMTLVSLISYIDRNALALLAPTILDELRLSGQEYGFMIAAFSVAYSARCGSPSGASSAAAKRASSPAHCPAKRITRSACE